MILGGCLSWNDATKALSTQVIMIVVASLALGSALLKTGALITWHNCFSAFREAHRPQSC